MEDLGNRDDLARRNYTERVEIDSDGNCAWSPGTIPNEYACKEIAISIADAQTMYLDTVRRIELPMSINDLDPHASMIETRRNSQI